MASLPPSVRDGVVQAIRDLSGSGVHLTGATAVGGGCINNGVRIETSQGERYFLKWNASAPAGMFEAEADGLNALRAAADRVEEEIRPKVPRPLATRPSGSGPDWLLMEWLEPASGAVDDQARLGRGLARIHGLEEETDREGRPTFGWSTDNWIGSLPQDNQPSHSWADFWRDRRIAPQLTLAREGGHLRNALMDDLLAAIPAALAGVGTPSLLHGDLWSGNSYATAAGVPALVDPAVYRGHGEVDLAMSELFGGFTSSFYEAYEEVRPISAGYRSHRRALYQLYYLLVHVNLFGRSYVAGCRRVAEEVLSAVV